MVDPEGGGFIGRLKTWHESQHPKNRLYNLGIPGDSSTKILGRLKAEASIRKPDLILVQCGKNDAKRMERENASPVTSFEDYQNNVRSIIEEARTLSDIAWIGGYPFDESKTLPLTYWTNTAFFFQEECNAYGSAAKQICEELDVPYLSTSAEWTETDVTECLFEDGLHANAKGHEKLFEELKESLLNLYS